MLLRTQGRFNLELRQEPRPVYSDSRFNRCYLALLNQSRDVFHLTDFLGNYQMRFRSRDLTHEGCFIEYQYFPNLNGPSGIDHVPFYDSSNEQQSLVLRMPLFDINTRDILLNDKRPNFLYLGLLDANEFFDPLFGIRCHGAKFYTERH